MTHFGQAVRRAGGRILSIIGLALLLGGCVGYSVSTDYQSGTLFGGYESYAWVDSAPADDGDRPAWDSEILGQRVENAVDEVMNARGWRREPASQADLHISYTTRNEKELSGSSVGIGYGTGNVFLGQSLGLHTYERGTLIIDIRERESGRLLWRGWTSTTVGSSPLHPQEVKEMVQAILAEFPPA